MTIVFISIFIILAIYALTLGWLAIGFARNNLAGPTTKHPETDISIIICARNEEQYIARCLLSILEQDYPKQLIEIILIDDGSNDRTSEIALQIFEKSNINYHLIKNPNALGKKTSLQYTIPKAKHQLIITRDADTYTTNKHWLSSISEHQEATKSDLIIGPVALSQNGGILWALQAIENNILSVLAGGSAYFKKPFLCSGANLAFKKDVFLKTEGYQNHLQIASGDDVLFMEDVKAISNSIITYLKDQRTIVYTYPCFSFNELINQKNRWASKYKVNPNRLNYFLAAISLLTNGCWLFCLMYGYLQPINNSATIIFISLKLLIDFLLLLLSAGFIRTKHLLWYSLPVGCVYPIYAVIVGLSAIFIKPDWKK